MKNFKMILFAFVMLSTCTIISSCTSKAKTTNEAKQGKEYTSTYICPMHCAGSGSAAPGECPVCGMDYEKNEEN